MGGRSSRWFLNSDGNFFWSGNTGTDEPIKKILTHPLDVLVCTQKFGERPGFYKNYGSPKGHNGLDFRTRQPDGTWKVSVYAAMDGVVSEANENEGNGKFIRIDHSNGYQSVYCHLSEVSVEEGVVVMSGQKIGIYGNSGAASEAPHLHFGYRPVTYDRDNGYMGYIDPTEYLMDDIRYV